MILVYIYTWIHFIAFLVVITCLTAARLDQYFLSNLDVKADMISGHYAIRTHTQATGGGWQNSAGDRESPPPPPTAWGTPSPMTNVEPTCIGLSSYKLQNWLDSGTMRRNEAEFFQWGKTRKSEAQWISLCNGFIRSNVGKWRQSPISDHPNGPYCYAIIHTLCFPCG